MDADTWCTYRPEGGTAIEPIADAAVLGVHWSEPAENRLSKVPLFLRKMIKKRAEIYVAELGAQEVTTGHLDTLSARRFGTNMPRRPGA
jgi:hypothetical protein